MTREDVAALWDLLCHVSGPRPKPEFLTEEQWREAAIEAWSLMADECGWRSGEVLDAVLDLAEWRKTDTWRYTDTGELRGILPADIDQMLQDRRELDRL